MSLQPRRLCADGFADAVAEGGKPRLKLRPALRGHLSAAWDPSAESGAPEPAAPAGASDASELADS